MARALTTTCASATLAARADAVSHAAAVARLPQLKVAVLEARGALSTDALGSTSPAYTQLALLQFTLQLHTLLKLTLLSLTLPYIATAYIARPPHHQQQPQDTSQRCLTCRAGWMQCTPPLTTPPFHPERARLWWPCGHSAWCRQRGSVCRSVMQAPGDTLTTLITLRPMWVACHMHKHDVPSTAHHNERQRK